eukprot:12732.XXX_385517_385672_1 [CDS] Oithona nana genome sequencing.
MQSQVPKTVTFLGTNFAIKVGLQVFNQDVMIKFDLFIELIRAELARYLPCS